MYGDQKDNPVMTKGYWGDDDDDSKYEKKTRGGGGRGLKPSPVSASEIGQPVKLIENRGTTGQIAQAQPTAQRHSYPPPPVGVPLTGGGDTQNSNACPPPNSGGNSLGIHPRNASAPFGTQNHVMNNKPPPQMVSAAAPVGSQNQVMTNPPPQNPGENRLKNVTAPVGSHYQLIHKPPPQTVSASNQNTISNLAGNQSNNVPLAMTQPPPPVILPVVPPISHSKVNSLLNDHRKKRVIRFTLFCLCFFCIQEQGSKEVMNIAKEAFSKLGFVSQLSVTTALDGTGPPVKLNCAVSICFSSVYCQCPVANYCSVMFAAERLRRFSYEIEHLRWRPGRKDLLQ
jgi:hypothetical protein